MGSDTAASVAIKFVERLNRRDVDGLVELMSPDHRLCPGGEEALTGPEEAREGLSAYVSSWPEFQIHIADVYVIDNTVVLVGRTTGSCAGLSREDEIRERRLYVAKIVNGLVAEFRHYAEDTAQVRSYLGATPATKITH
jgi:hypothetical protein